MSTTLTATPLVMARRKTVLTPTTEVVYTTTTGDKPRPAPINPVAEIWYEEEAYCFVCSRCTDHGGEHDALVEAGLASYGDKSGSVYKTDKWDADLAREIADAEYQRLYGHLGL